MPPLFRCAFWRESRCVHARGRGRTHGAHIPPPGMAGYALRACRWQESRSVHSENAEKRQDMRSVHAKENARSAYSGTGMPAARFLPIDVVRIALRACSRLRGNAQGAFPAARNGMNHATCMLAAPGERKERFLPRGIGPRILPQWLLIPMPGLAASPSGCKRRVACLRLVDGLSAYAQSISVSDDGDWADWVSRDLDCHLPLTVFAKMAADSAIVI